MPTALKTLVILILVALMPLRAMAAVTIGFCATGHGEPAAAAHAGHDHGADAHAHHGSDVSSGDADVPSCSSCVEHCSSAAFAPSAVEALGALAVVRDRIHLAERAAPVFLTYQLDRPPLA